MTRFRLLKFASWLRLVLPTALVLASLAFAQSARADQPNEDLSGLASTDASEVSAAIVKAANRGDARALPVLRALDEGTLRFDSQKRLLIKSDTGALKDALSLSPTTAQGALEEPASDNEVRRALSPALASLSLSAGSPAVRLKAAHDLGRPSEELVPIIRAALTKETDADVKIALSLALAPADIASDNPADRVRALKAIRAAADASFKGDAERLVSKRADGNYVEPDAEVRAAAFAAISAIETRQFLINIVGNTFYGLSLGSVLILCALGLAITFGLMGVINMAHGEMIAVGAYTCYVVQNLFGSGFGFSIVLPFSFGGKPISFGLHLPGLNASGLLYESYFLFAIPLSFVMAALAGLVIERLVIRFLYRRPLESLLATWGVSLVMQQCFRMVFGANNVQVNSPSWLLGHFTITDIIFGYNRVFVILFAVIIVVGTWLLLTKTPMGLLIRSVMQNRDMASCIGVRTDRVNMMTFAFGSGLAGLAGAFLSQIGNVGPSLGQSYIVDSFMTVVVGGVGSIIGTVCAALGIGTSDQVLQQTTGSPVTGKIVVLVAIILFLQWKPGGLFSIRSRSLD